MGVVHLLYLAWLVYINASVIQFQYSFLMILLVLNMILSIIYYYCTFLQNGSVVEHVYVKLDQNNIISSIGSLQNPGPPKISRLQVRYIFIKQYTKLTLKQFTQSYLFQRSKMDRCLILPTPLFVGGILLCNIHLAYHSP